MFRIAKRGETNNRQALMFRLLGIFGALLVTSVIVMFMDHNPFDVLFSMVKGAFASKIRIENTIVKAVPLAITAIGISIAFRMKFWNIGGEGQIMMGAAAATYVALNYSSLPRIILLPLMFVTAFIFGGIWAVVPALFKVRFGTNETLFTLMMNYIALKLVGYFQYTAWKDPNGMGFPVIAKFEQSGYLPEVFGIHIGWIIAILIAVFIYLLVHHTKRGYEINVVGGSENTARYAGMKVGKIVVLSMLLSGGICGIAGFVQVSGVSHTLNVNTSGGVGFTAIIIAWLSKLNEGTIILVSILFAGMVQGGNYIQTAFQIPASVAQILQGIILLFVLGSEFFVQYKVFYNKKEVKKA
ncbi:MAG: ABC transporter permease [Clostridia bacterium]|nr:ABC transporter permease [Clostridia bacterium]